MRDPQLYVIAFFLVLSLVFAILFAAGVLEYAFTRIGATVVLFAFSSFFLIRYIRAFENNVANFEKQLYFAIPTTIEATFGEDNFTLEEDTIDENAPDAVHETNKYAYRQLRLVERDEYTALCIKPTDNSISIVAIRNSENSQEAIERAIAFLRNKGIRNH